jgi:endonuclease G
MARTRAKTVTLDTLPEEFRVPEAVRARIDGLRDTLEAATQRIARGLRPAESKDRTRMIAERQAVQRGRPVTLADIALQERIIGADDLLPIGFFSRGLLAARSVARLRIEPLNAFGTGFLVAPDILITNNHVLPVPSLASAATVEFEMFDTVGRIAEVREVRLDPERFFFTHEVLDVTLVALVESRECREATEDLGWHPMIAQEGKIRLGDPVNIIQHPGGRAKTVVVHNSNLLHIENRTPEQARALAEGATDDGVIRDPFLWYSSDTERGSSGAPVFNPRWEVVGIHHRSVPDTNAKGELIDPSGAPISQEAFAANPDLAVWIANEGTRTSRIVAALERASFARALPERARDGLLALWEASRGHNQGQEAVARAVRGRAATRDDAPFTEAANGPRGTELRAGGVTLNITVTPDRLWSGRGD